LSYEILTRPALSDLLTQAEMVLLNRFAAWYRKPEKFLTTFFCAPWKYCQLLQLPLLPRIGSLPPTVFGRRNAARGTTMAKPRILLADDHALILDGFCKLLEPQYEIVAKVSDGRELLRVAPVVKPDIILLDIAMPTLNGIDAGRQLKKLFPSLKIVLLTVNADYDLAQEAVGTWASGYFLKTSPGPELLRAIREVLRGGKYMAPQFARRSAEEFVRDPREIRPRPLTDRQREVLQLLTEGRSMKEVAAELKITLRTVGFHKYEIMEKHGLKSNADLVLFAIKHHVLPGVDH
jgi:DNA-binding NarL/FixJ family response regulator